MTTKKFPEASARDARGYERSGADEDVRMELNKPELTSRLLAAACLAAALTLLSQGEGFKRIVLNARLGAEGFYARFGYQAEGDPFDENTIPHIRMSKDLA